MSEITKAIIDLIHSQPAAIIGVVGTLLGAIVSVSLIILWEIFKSRGKVSLSAIHSWRMLRNDVLTFEVSLRAFNGSPYEKTLTVTSVRFLDKAIRQHFIDTEPSIGLCRDDCSAGTDVSLEPKAYQRLHVKAYTQNRNHPKPSPLTSQLCYIAVDFLVLPNTKITQRFLYSEAIDMLNEDNLPLINAHLK